MQQTASKPLDIFIESWGRMGTQWGVGKVMAEIQALLYLSPDALSLEDMSERLKTSRSNISLNVRALQDLGVVHKVIIPGDRKDYYLAEANVGKVARRLAAKKKKRELDPALRFVNEAIRAADCDRLAVTQPQDFANMNIAKLHELRDLMEAIAGVFDAFIGDESSETRSADSIKA